MGLPKIEGTFKGISPYLGKLLYLGRPLQSIGIYGHTGIATDERRTGEGIPRAGDRDQYLENCNMAVSQNSGTPTKTPKYSSPY